ncbi:class F sortase [Streptomyces sp. NPDC046985]|uniref:class F sortase n=1 Tax=Streptomyces sp. NPDC046985 TaxID=3155377 RepID=UPI00340258CD
MASQQPPQTEQCGTEPAPRRGRLRILWPAAAVGLGLVLIHQSLGSPVASTGLPPRPAVTVPASRTSPTSSTPSKSSASSAASASSTASASSAPPSAAAKPDDGSLPRSEPKRLTIPDIGVDAPFTGLSLDSTGHLTAPPADDTNLVGWFKGGASPGERGASIVVGHLDTTTGPAVFVELDSLKQGDTVNITRADGIVAHFKVDTVDTYSKTDFPDDQVYSDTSTPELRLITCGGTFDRAAQNYEDNVVVSAHLDSSDSGQ